jgi:hypothetical protein
LEITCAAISGGAGAKAAFVDSSKFVKSDAKYTITVDVTNQKLVANDVTEFSPIPNVPASKFNEIYGDSYISGFIEGGVLNAVVLKRVLDEDELSKIGGGIKVDLSVAGGAVSVKGSAEGEKAEGKKKTETETTIR